MRLTPNETINVQYDEQSVAADVQWTLGSIRIFSEFALNLRQYTESGRPPASGFITLVVPSSELRLQPDTDRYGGYLIGGYRFGWLGLMPFFQLEWVRLDDPTLPWTVGIIGGINARPNDAVTFKLHYGIGWFPGADPRGPGRDTTRALESQVAWAF